ncbi:MAG: OmpH family outer membrane protein [Parabacteroides sp.]|nr:OmpH family outer membrane protein [Parabacteroides sp.]
MKNINYVVNGVLAVAVIILFVMQFSGKNETKTVKSISSGETPNGTMPVAYVNVDSLLENYNYAKDLNEIILKKSENSRASVNQKANSLRTEMQEFQRKIENNAFLTRERAEQEQQRLLQKQQELQELDARLSQELLTEQQKLNEQLRDTVVAQLKVYNKDKGYHIIYSNTMGDNILYAQDGYDITAELLEYLNKNYSNASK